MFYQPQNSLNADMVKTDSGIDFSFPAHLHSSFELITVTEGMMVVTVSGKKYNLTPGEFCLVFPNQVHELHTPVHSRHFLFIFSEKLVNAYKDIYSQSVPENNVVRLPSYLAENLMSISEKDRLMKVKGLLYLTCAEFDKRTTYVPRSIEKDDLFLSIFKFVEENYDKDCSLSALSEEISYHYVYLSKYFKQHIGVSFTDYVNRYRVNEACYLLKNTSETILQTAYSCGFNSLRSFNRIFKEVLGMTPSDYKKKPQFKVE